MPEKDKTVYYHPDGEDSGVDFGARRDNEDTKQAIGQRILGVIKELPNGTGRQLIVKAGHVPLPIKIGIGVATLGGAIYGTYEMAKLFARLREKHHWDTKKNLQNSNTKHK